MTASGGTRPGELVHLTGLSSGGVTQLLDRLEHAGLVSRRSGQPPDRRVVAVTLTPLGRRALEDRVARVHDLLATIHSALLADDGMH